MSAAAAAAAPTAPLATAAGCTAGTAAADVEAPAHLRPADVEAPASVRPGRLPVARERAWLLPPVQRVGAALSRLLLGTRVVGAHHVPRRGPVVLAANHASWLDGPLVLVHAPRPGAFLVKVEAFAGAAGRLLDVLGQVALDRTRPDRGALRRVRDVLAGGGLVGVFPEGTRGDGRLGVVRPGAAWLALAAGAPVVPVAVLGTHETLGQARRPSRRRHGVAVVFGEPVEVHAEGDRHVRRVWADASERLAERLRAHLAHAEATVAR